MMDTVYDFLYVYGTGNRPDGMRVAVAASWTNAGNDTVALFREVADAHRWAYAEQERTGVTVHILPSAEWDGE